MVWPLLLIGTHPLLAWLPTRLVRLLSILLIPAVAPSMWVLVNQAAPATQKLGLASTNRPTLEQPGNWLVAALRQPKIEPLALSPLIRSMRNISTSPLPPPPTLPHPSPASASPPP